jgi:hypothetical protein
MENRFDELSKALAQGISRRQAVKLFTAGLAGAVFAALTGKAEAAPRTCRSCVCGVGQPCNPKETRCAGPGQTCQQICAQQHLSACGPGSTFHCPQGCPG